MAIDRSKVLAAAQKALSKGQHEKAIREYRKLVEADPSDVRIWLKVGDLYQKIDDRRAAVETYNRVAEQYAEQGFFLKAVAVYKRIIKLAPGRLEVSLRLAEMYENLQLTSDALGTYEQVGAAYARAGDTENMLNVLGRMAELDPENIPVRIKYAEALSKASKTEEAAVEFEAGAELLREQGRIDDYLKVAERLLYHRPEDMALARELASNYVERGDAKRALGKLQLCFKQDPKDAQTLELLGRAFHLLGQTPKTISVYRELARVHQEAGRGEERARILGEILRLDPNDGEARQALAAYAPPTAAAPDLLEEDDEPELEIIEPDEDDIELVEDLESFDDDLEIIEEIEEVEEAPAEPARPSIPPEIAREAQIARLLTECEVFERYGLSDKVIRQLQQVLEIAPDHLEARERLKDTLLNAGENDAAAAELLRLADAYEGGNPQVATLYRRQASELGAPAGRVPMMPPVAGPADIPRSDDEESEPILFVDDDDEDEVIIDTDDEVDDLSSIELADSSESLTDSHDDATDSGRKSVDPLEMDRHLSTFQPRPSPTPDSAMFLEMELPSAPPAAPGPPSPEPPTPLHPIPLEDDDATFVGSLDDIEPFPDDDRTPGPATDRPVSPPAPALLDVELSDIEPPADVVAQPLADASLVPPPVEDANAQAEREALERNSMPAGEVEEILDEVDFYIAQGLWDAGASTLEDALASYPQHPVLMDKLQEIEDGRAAQAAAASVVPSPPEDDAFALAEKLAEELGEVEAEDVGSDVLDVDQLFEQFKRGVAEQIDSDDSETHFDLGIAYKEMGRIDDAIGEFELAMQNPKRECLCQTMIGLCRAEQGRLSEAIAHYKKGLYVEQKTEAEELGLYYELGVAYENLDDPQEAIYYYQKVIKRDPKFRDASRRLDALSKNDAAAQPLELDDVDAAFDDLMGDD